MTDHLVPVPLADNNVRRLFDEPALPTAKRGYDPAGVARFLDELGERTITLIERLRGAEAEAEAARSELDDYRLRADEAESSRHLFERTLALAEETANASVVDAQARAERIEAVAQADCRRMVDDTRLRVERMMDAARADVQQIYDDERQAIADAHERIADEQHRISDESARLETLRLAVAVETMALEEVRNEMRRRVRRASTELLGVAESQDCLGTPVTRGISEVVARQTEASLEQESELPDGPAASRSELPAEPSALGVATATPAPASEEVPVAAEEAAPAMPMLIDADPTVPIDLDEAAAEDDAEVPEGAEMSVASGEPTATAKDAGEADAKAFERFMSEDIEDEPSRNWILA